MRHLTAAFALCLAACGASTNAPRQAQQAGCGTRAYSEIGGPISLIDQTGARVTEADFKGRPSIIYFGFTYCPDVCPTALITVERALRRLPEDMERPRTILISVDPERDTPEALAQYVDTDAFPDDLVGLTGSPAEVRAAADAFKAWYERIDTSESLVGYTMDHSSILYVMDETWSLETFFTHEDTDETIAACLEARLS